MLHETIFLSFAKILKFYIRSSSNHIIHLTPVYVVNLLEERHIVS